MRPWKVSKSLASRSLWDTSLPANQDFVFFTERRIVNVKHIVLCVDGDGVGILPSHVDYAECAAHEVSDKGNEQRMGKCVVVLASSQKTGMIGKIDVRVKESLVARAFLCISCDELLEAVGINQSAKQGTSIIVYDMGQLEELGLSSFILRMLLMIVEQLSPELVFGLGIASSAVIIHYARLGRQQNL